MTDEEYQIRRKYVNRNLMQELEWVSRYPPSGMSNQDKDFIRWLAMTAYDRINDIPSADVRPVVRGKWKNAIQSCNDSPHVKCSVCGEYYWRYFSKFNFCPNCGADMREGS